ncbi:response regulator containing CheY-like receiver domain and AraC-type DNA-binding domain [Thermobacillus composti KWC4]|uniref:Response regulator containing CheY-like receiver domain and AraC-type DNA-binding domain n=2 Tax=Thermobacillus TaxID=76632 RepID=L0EHA7_THECK|nr:response regulator containing CheY-like receiver domain and AraC-type DNA-binding domain [Thermobacillus composti KWC4]
MPYNLLIVDDEALAVEGVKADLEPDKLDIGKLFTAFNANQAKDIFARERVDILLCDIEMPQGSGLELLRWVREQRFDTVSIFLTCHSDFHYAKEAIRLGSLDYLLKPVLKADLEQAIRQAQAVIDRNNEMNKFSQVHQLWMKHHALIIERFWLDLVNHVIPANPMAIREHIEQLQLPFAEDMIVLPILISVQRWHKELTRRDERVLEYALKKTAEEMILGDRYNGMFLSLDKGLLLGILVAGRNFVWDYERLNEICNQYIESCNRYFYCDLSCYLGLPAAIHQVADMAAKLRAQDQNNVAFVNRVFVLNETGSHERTIRLPDLNVWLSLLKNGTREHVIGEIEEFLEGLVRQQKIDSKALHQIHQDVMQAIYTYLNIKGIQAHQLFGDQESIRISAQAGRSVRDLLAWVHHAVNKAVDQAEAVRESSAVVQTVKQYIANHIDDEGLTREAVARVVFLNPDHLSRMFKKETGFSISDYILLERINLAKQLLDRTNIPISAIASSVGYTNFSHFAKIFKKYTGVKPSEYRSRISQRGQDTAHDRQVSRF